MADSQDRNLPATERKLRKAREQGQVARSRELTHFVVIGLGTALLVGALHPLSTWLQHLLVATLRFDAHSLAAPGMMLEQFGRASWKALLVVLPVGALMALAGVLCAWLSGGWNFTFQPLAPKLEKLDPLAGLGRMFSWHQLGETLKACLLALVLGAIGALYLSQRLPHFVHTIALPLPAALAHTGAVLLSGLLLLLVALALFAVVDVPLQRHRLATQLRMSVQEVKQEHKDAEGNTEVKARIKARMREMANRRMLADVPKADLVIMNPSHFAVALKYDEHRMAAPRVLAKGADLMAFRIRDAAQGAKVPVLQAPPLARALFAHCEVGGEIPAALFSAVAQVLAYVYQLRAALRGAAPMPAALPQLKLPPGMDPGPEAGAPA